MSNLEVDPSELVCSAAAPPTATELLRARAVPLGGPRGMTVHRSLPQRSRSLIGPWCFVDHYGPDDVSTTGGMRVAGHPHTGLQTVSWLFRGEVEHRDTAGNHAIVRPGELNLMTAGSGIAHSEYSTGSTAVLHGVQLWIALPESGRFTAAGFQRYAPQSVVHDGARVLVFLGSLLGRRAPVDTYSPVVGAEIAVPAGTRALVDVDPAFEHGVLVDSGEATVDGVTAAAREIVYRAPGAPRLSIESSPDAATRVLLLGGEPFGERIVMWWNFIGRSHDEIVRYRGMWEDERVGGGSPRFGRFPPQWRHTLPAPPMPTTRLRPRR